MSKINKFSILGTILKTKLGLQVYPSFITFHVTWRCNCKCNSCEIWKRNPGNELNHNEIGSVFSQLNSIDAIRITGGEPFIRDDIIEVVNIINSKSNPKIIHLTTNGLCTDNIIRFIQNVNLNILKKIHLKVSLDCPGSDFDKKKGVQGAFDIVMQTINQIFKLQRSKHIYFGIDQTIIDDGGFNDYHRLKNIFTKRAINFHPIFAYPKNVSLYIDKGNPLFQES